MRETNRSQQDGLVPLCGTNTDPRNPGNPYTRRACRVACPVFLPLCGASEVMKNIVLMAACLMSVSAWGQSEPKAGGVLSSANGRYVFGQVSQARRDQYMLDTQTGRLWQIVQSTYKKEDGSQGTYEMLQSIPYDQMGGVLSLPPSIPGK